MDALRKTLRDDLYQNYLMSLPERMIRKQFIHAENVTGFSADVLRNFKTSAAQYANQMAKLQYARKIELKAKSAYDALEGRDPEDAERLRVFINEIAERAEQAPDRGGGHVGTVLAEFE